MTAGFDAVGPSSSGTQSGTSPLTWTHVCGGSATLLLVGISVDAGSSDASVTAAVTYNGVAMTSLLRWESGGSTQHVGFVQVFWLLSPATGSNTVSVTLTGSGFDGITGGSLSYTGASGVGTPVHADSNGASVTTGTIAVTAAATSRVAAFAATGSGLSSFTAGTSRFNNTTGAGFGGGASFSAAADTAGAGGSTSISWNQGSDFFGAVAVEVTGSAPAATPVLARPYRSRLPRGYQPQRRRLLAVPLPPQTFAGAVTMSGSGTLTAIAAPVITGMAGSGASSYFTDQAGRPRPMFGDTPWGLLISAGRWSSGAWQSDIDTYMANRAGQGYTAIELDLMANTVITGTPTFSGQTWDGIFPFVGGSSPGDPSAGLTSTYWARFDYLLNSAAARGITVFANVGITYDIGSGGCLSALTNTQLHDYGFNLASRYLGAANIIWRIEDDYFGSDDSKLDQILAGIRAAGDTRPISCQNYAESTSRRDLASNAVLTWGNTNTQYQWVYSYNVAYFGVEQAYTESSPILVLRGDGYYYKDSGTADDELIRNHFWWSLASGSRGFNGGDDRVWQFGSQASYTDTANANAGQFHTAVMANGSAFFASLPNWHLLIPDTGNVFITAGRGTRATSLPSGGGGGAYSGTSDAYVSASLTAAGDLAVIYPTHHGSFTIDQTKLVAGYTATWVDPVTCATTPTTPGSSYDSTSLGNNSAGAPDWVLVLQAATTPAGSASLSGTGTLSAGPQLAATAGLSGAGTLSASPVLTGVAALSGAGSLTAAPQLAGAASLSGSGTLSATATTGTTAALSGQGTLSAAVTTGTTASLSGSGTLTASPVSSIAATASLSGLGSLSVPGEIIGTAATLSGAGTLTAAPQLPATAALSGSGSLTAGDALAGAAPLSGTGSLTAAPQLTAAAVLSGTGTLAVPGVTLGTVAALSGTGTLTAPWQLQPAAPLTGSGTLTAGAALTGAAGLSGLGTLTASPQLAASAALSGSGTLSSSPNAPASVNLSGTGSLTASPALTGTASLTGSGTLTAGPQLPSAAALSGTGTLSAAPTMPGTATLAGSGTLTAAWALSPAVGLSGAGTLSYAQGQAAATLTGSGSLTASPVLRGAAALSGSGTLAPAGVLVLAGMASLAGQGTLTAVLQLGSAAALTGAGVLTAQAQRPSAGSQAMFMAALGDA